MEHGTIFALMGKFEKDSILQRKGEPYMKINNAS